MVDAELDSASSVEPTTESELSPGLTPVLKSCIIDGLGDTSDSADLTTADVDGVTGTVVGRVAGVDRFGESDLRGVAGAVKLVPGRVATFKVTRQIKLLLLPV